MTSSFSLFLFDNQTERGAMQLVFRTPTLTPTRTPTGVVRGCFSLFVIVRKPLKNLRFWLPLIQENRPIFSSSPVATTTNPWKHYVFEGFSFSSQAAMFILECQNERNPSRRSHRNSRWFPNDTFFSPARRGVQNPGCSPSCITKRLPLEIHASVWLKWQALCVEVNDVIEIGVA